MRPSDFSTCSSHFYTSTAAPQRSNFPGKLTTSKYRPARKLLYFLVRVSMQLRSQTPKRPAMTRRIRFPFSAPQVPAPGFNPLFYVEPGARGHGQASAVLRIWQRDLGFASWQVHQRQLAARPLTKGPGVGSDGLVASPPPETTSRVTPSVGVQGLFLIALRQAYQRQPAGRTMARESGTLLSGIAAASNALLLCADSSSRELVSRLCL